jgi:hypothetical protein
MREYVVLPAELAADTAEAMPWVRRALDHVASKPPKAGR